MELTDFPTTLIEFEERFATERSCHDYLAKVRWPEGFHCPKCGGKRGWTLRTRPQIECGGCGRQVSLTSGTILHGSRKPLRVWFRAFFLAACQKTGTSARNLARQLGLNYETAWTWMHKIRRAMVRPGRDPLVGPVEVDEAYVGGQEEGVTGRQTEKKSLVGVAVEVREGAAGRVRMEVLADASKDSLHPFVEHNVKRGTPAATDGWPGYGDLGKLGIHHWVTKIRDPKKSAVLFPHVHRAISLLKRWLLGTYQGAVQRNHLQAYLNEFEFRFNRRRSNHVTLPFQRLCQHAVVTPPISYSDLTQHVVAT
jgi:transposase-like protein